MVLKSLRSIGGGKRKGSSGPIKKDSVVHKSRKLEFTRTFEEEKRGDELNLLTTIERQTLGVLGELQYIRATIDTHKGLGKVENLKEKVQAAYQRIRAYIAAENEAELDAIVSQRRTSGGIIVEENPLIKEMGGLPLETISSEWEETMGNLLDKAELENLINKKLKAKLELANKLRLRNKPANQPKLKESPKLTPDYSKKLKQELKLILKEVPEPPKPGPTFVPPAPRPY